MQVLPNAPSPAAELLDPAIAAVHRPLSALLSNDDSIEAPDTAPIVAAPGPYNAAFAQKVGPFSCSLPCDASTHNERRVGRHFRDEGRGRLPQ